VVAIPLFLFIFAVVEFTRGLMTIDSLEEAARCGCRVAVTQGASLEGVTNEVDRLMDLAGISVYTVAIEPVSLDDAPVWTPVTVTISATFANASWLPLPRFLQTKSHVASCTLPREADPNN
jgi:Flp pilus assembly protein TadG